jgi:hypothetical protein
MPDQYNKIFNLIPVHIGELYLENETREAIAKKIYLGLNNECAHNFAEVAEVRLINPKICKKCGKLKESSQ